MKEKIDKIFKNWDKDGILAALISLAVCIFLFNSCSPVTENNLGNSNETGFTIPRSISGDLDFCSDPAIAVDGSGNIDIVWRGVATRGDFWITEDLYFTRSGDKGKSWTTPMLITGGVIKEEPDIAADISGNIYIVFLLPDPEDKYNKDVYFMRSIDNGQNWTHPVKFDDGDDISSIPAIKTSVDGDIYVAWVGSYLNDRVHIAHSDDGGETWKRQEIALDYRPYSGVSSPISMAVDTAGNINLVWAAYYSGILDNKQDSGIFHTRSIDKGATWTEPKLVHDTSMKSVLPTATCDSQGKIYVIFRSQYETASLGYQVYFVHSADNGTSWNSTQLIFQDKPGIGYPRIAVNDAGVIHALWAWRQRYEGDIYHIDAFYTRSANGGSAWEPERSLNKSFRDGDCYYPKMTLDGNGKLYIVWHLLYKKNKTNYSEIYFLGQQPLF